MLITEIGEMHSHRGIRSVCFMLNLGNALGYVRMVRSASMYYCSEAVKYLPDFEDVINFENYAGAAGDGTSAYV